MMFLLLLSIPTFVHGQCTDGNTLTFVKVAGFKPRLPYQPTLLYSATYGSSVTPECYNRCKNSSDCVGFILYYATSSCFRVTDGNDSKFGLISDPGVSYFSKICLPLPEKCSSMAWSVETAIGYELLGQQHTIVPNVDNRWTCIKECLVQAYRGEPCLSANYYASTQTCTLSSYDRWSNPDLFVPTTQKVTEYIENNCLEELDEKKCWQLPLYNTTSLRSDLLLYGVSENECREKCENETNFKCRAFSYLDLATTQCLLHSDPAIINPGPILYPELTPTLGGEYSEMINCVNLSVSCDKKNLMVTLLSKKFRGVLSVRGHSSTCSALGKGSDSTSLVIPLPEGEKNKCNLNVAYSFGDVNRTLISTVIIVQYHELIQRSGDRVIKTTCVLTEGEPQVNNITLGTGYIVQEQGVQSEVSGIGGTNASAPLKARMYLLDGRTGSEVRDVKLGDPLILRIALQSPYNVSIVHAGHLVATSGDRLESLLLLDWNGCPPDSTVFPALTKTSDNTLEASFKAFRFQSTQLLSLALVLTFCKNQCEPVDCGNGVVSYGRKKREVKTFSELPLELSIMVNVQDESNINSSPILQASSFESKSLDDKQVCTTFMTAALISLFWILLQCSLLAVCCCVLQKRKEREADTISLRHDFQPQRHVTFLDEVDSPPSILRLSTPVKA